MKKRILSMILVICMLVSLAPAMSITAAANGEPWADGASPANDQIFYTATAAVGAAMESYDSENSSFDSTTGKGIMKFTGELTAIDGEAFEGNRSILSIILPASVQSVGDRAFNSCKSMTSIVMPNVTTIGAGTFSGCQLLESINMLNVTSIGTAAFEHCEKLASISMPSIISIGDSAFLNCIALHALTLPDTLKNIGEGAFADDTSEGHADIMLLGTPESIGAGTLSNVNILVASPAVKETEGACGTTTFNTVTLQQPSTGSLSLATFPDIPAGLNIYAHSGSAVKVEVAEVPGYTATLSGTYTEGSEEKTLTIGTDGTFTMPEYPVTVTATYTDISTLHPALSYTPVTATPTISEGKAADSVGIGTLTATDFDPASYTVTVVDADKSTTAVSDTGITGTVDTAGTSPVLKVSTTTATAKGTYWLKVTGTEDSLTADVWVSVTVSAAAPAESITYERAVSEKNSTDGKYCGAIAYWEKVTCNDYTLVEDSSTAVTWSEGCYVVKGTDVKIDGTVTVIGDVHLVLCDGAKLTVNGDAGQAGIFIEKDKDDPYKNHLTICGDTYGTGTLIANGNGGGAGIGGHNGLGYGVIEISGGHIIATGGSSTTERYACGAGIGGGFEDGKIELGNYIGIYGGVIEAYGGNATLSGAAGIGSGGKGKATDMCSEKYFQGGTVLAVGGSCVKGGYGLGIGDSCDSRVGSDNLRTCGNVDAKRVTIKGGSSRDAITTDITSKYDDAWRVIDYQYITVSTSPYTITKATGITNGSIEISAETGNKGDTVTVTATADNGYKLDKITVYETSHDATTVDVTSTATGGTFVMPSYDVTVTATYALDPVKYLDAAGKEQSCTTYTEVTDSTDAVTWTDGWYVVKGDNVSITNTVTVSGDVHLILMDGAKLTVNGTENTGNAGINVSGGANSLTVYAQSTGSTMGALEATGNKYFAMEMHPIYQDLRAMAYSGAGIGGNDGQDGGNITINGGTVTATGADFAAGIGGGKEGNGSNITINGGVVKATGKDDAAGIGGGKEGNGSNITINGGTVTATGYGTAAGIGGGNFGNGSNIKVATTLCIKQGDDAADTVVSNTGSDLAGTLTKSHVYIEKAVPTYVCFIDADNDGTFDENDGEVGYTTVQGAVDEAVKGVTKAEDAKTVKLLKDVDLTATLTVARDTFVKLDLNGKVLNGSTITGTGSVITNNGNLTVKDSATTANTHFFKVLDSGLWQWQKDFTGTETYTFSAADGLKKDGTASTDIPAKDSVVKVTGGVITGGKGSINKDCGVTIDAGSKFTLNSGCIMGNNGSHGGGVYMEIFATLDIDGGSIIGNSATSGGGGVYLSDRSTLNLITGSISYNSGLSGGGVWIFRNAAANIAGGSISYNSARSYGSGVWNGSSSTLTMTGGEITGNTGAQGVYQDGSMTVGGTARITGNTVGTGESAKDCNLYLPSGSTVAISTDKAPVAKDESKPTEPYMLIGVTLASGTGNVTTAASADYSGCFKSDSADYVVKNDTTGGDTAQVVKLTLPSVKYLDKDGKEQSCSDYTVITDSTTELQSTVTGGWYVVKGADVKTGSLTVTGDVHLILTDGAKLTASGADGGTGQSGKDGITIGYGGSLTVYGQTNSTGILNANGGKGGDDTYDGGHGGNGINGTVSIFGGIVNAGGGKGGESPDNNGAGGDGILGNVFVSGGALTTKGGNSGNGTEDAYGFVGEGICGDLKITGGTVTAIGGNNDSSTQEIAGGDGIQGNVFASGGYVTATGGMPIKSHKGFGINASSITTTGMIVKAGSEADPTTVITDTNSSGSIADELKGKRYVTIEKAVPTYVCFIDKDNDGTFDENDGEVGYTTVQAAVSAATAGQTVKLLADTEEAVAVKNKTVTLDLNGKTLSYKNGCTLSITGTANVTVTDSSADKTGMIKATGDSGVETVAVKKADTGTFTLANGKLCATGTADCTGKLYGLYNTGTGKLELSGGTIEVASVGAKTFAGVYSSKGTTQAGGTKISVKSTGTTASGNSIYGVQLAVSAAFELSGGSVEVENGDGNATYGIYSGSSGTLTLSGGTVTVTGTGKGLVIGVKSITSTIALSGTAIKAKSTGTRDAYGMSLSGEKAATITGGSAVGETTGKGKAYGISVSGSVAITQSAGAVSGVVSGSGTAYGINSTGTGAITLSGGTVTGTSNGTGAAYGVCASADVTGDITVDGCVVSAEVTSAGGDVYGMKILGSGKFAVKSGSVTAKQVADKDCYGIAVGGTREMTLSGGSITAETSGSKGCHALRVNDSASLTMSDGTVTATANGTYHSCGICNNGTGKVSISGGEVISKASEASDCLVLNALSEGEYEVTGGKFNGELNVSGGEFTITGGEFTTDPTSYLGTTSCAEPVTGSEPYIYKVSKDPVAHDGSHGYDSVQKAIDNNKKATVTMVKDSKENVTVIKGKTITLDLNGKTLTGKGTGSVITVDGALTITDTASAGGTVTGGSAANGGGIYTSSTGTLTLTGGKITGNTATVKGGGVYSASGKITVSGNVNISGNTVGGKANNLYLGKNQTVTVATAGLADAAIGVTLESGTGAVTGMNSQDYHSFFVSDVVTRTAVNDGADDAQVVKVIDYEASITAGDKTTYYLTLAEAVAAVTSGTGEIQLLKDIALTATVNVSVAEDAEEQDYLTIDMNGHSISGNVRAFWVKEGNLILTGTGTVEANDTASDTTSVIRVGSDVAAAGLSVGENVSVKSNSCYGITYFGAKDQTVSVSGKVSVTGTASALSGNGSTAGKTELTVNANALISATQCVAIYNPQKGETRITGTVNGGIEVKAGKLTVDDGAVISALGVTPAYTDSQNGPSTVGYTVALINDAAYTQPAAVDLQGGTYSGGVFYGGSSAVSGYFTKKADLTIAAPTGYYWYKNTVLCPNTAVAEITRTDGVTFYSTLSDALDAAKDGETVTLVSDIVLAATVIFNSEKSVTVDMNGKNITSTDCRALWLKTGEIEFAGKGTIETKHTEGNTTFAETSSVIRVGSDEKEMDGDKLIAKEAKLTVGEDVTVTTAYCYGITAFGAGTVEYVYVHGTVSQTGNMPALGGNGTDIETGACFNVVGTKAKNAVVSSAGSTAIFCPQCAVMNVLNVSYATVTGNTGIELRAGGAAISNSTITATGTYKVTANGNGTTTEGAAIAIAEHTTKTGIILSVTGKNTVSGGDKGVAVSIANPQKNDTKDIMIYLNGGTFTGGLVMEEDYGYLVKKKAAVTLDAPEGFYWKDGMVLTPKSTPTASDFTFTAPESLTYDGNVRTANVETATGIIGMGEVTMRYYSDAQCTKEVAAADVSSAGTYYVGITVTGGDEYLAVTEVLTDSTWTFTIAPATITGISVAQDKPLTYNGTEQTATVAAVATTVNDQTCTFTYCTTADGTFTETVPAFKSAGEHTVYYKVTAPNHSEASGTFTVTISQADNRFTGTLKCDGFVYGGAPRPNGVKADFGTVVYLYSMDGKTWDTWANTNKGSGEYQVKAVVYETTDYNGCESAPVSFTVRASLKMTVSGDATARHTDVKTYTATFEGTRPKYTTVVWDITGATYEYVDGHIGTDSVTIICESSGTLKVTATLVDYTGKPVKDSEGRIIQATQNVTVTAQSGNIINMITVAVKTVAKSISKWFGR